MDPWGLAGKGPSIFDVIFPDTLNSGEDEELARIRDKVRRWRYDNGKFQPIDPKTGKPYKPQTKCYTETPPDFKPPKSPTQKPPASRAPKTPKEKLITALEALLRLFGHFK